jgi:HSP20 family molecular chaperone IbpA
MATHDIDRRREPAGSRRVPAVDIYEREEGMVLLADVPGVREKDLDIQVAEHVLTIEGRRERPSGGTVHVDEPGAGDYRREFRLSDDLDPAGIRATLRHGVLRLEIPKSERLRPRSIPIKTD